MAAFGLPGGAEWLLIGTIALILFVPGLGFGLLGYVLGRRSAGRERVALKAGGYTEAATAATDPGQKSSPPDEGEADV